MSLLLPVWWNGRRGRLKIYSGQPGAGSSPAIGNFFHKPCTKLNSRLSNEMRCFLTSPFENVIMCIHVINDTNEVSQDICNHFAK